MVNAVDIGYAKYFRIGVLGESDAVLRYGQFSNAFAREVVEIVFGERDNQLTVGRLQRRLLPSGVMNLDLQKAHTPDLLSPFHPVMMILKVSYNGQVDVFLDGERYAFLSFFNPARTPVNFMVFTKDYRDLMFFYDCPMRDPKFLELQQLNNTTVQP
uniref:Farnesoic acid O-methyl transferase domain-containing protein n=1 Tax=Anopheles culicifacies TaxID=139723 RepID=A0A182M1N9_9DIPT